MSLLHVLGCAVPSYCCAVFSCSFSCLCPLFRVAMLYLTLSGRREAEGFPTVRELRPHRAWHPVHRHEGTVSTHGLAQRRVYPRPPRGGQQGQSRLTTTAQTRSNGHGLMVSWTRSHGLMDRVSWTGSKETIPLACVVGVIRRGLERLWVFFNRSSLSHKL